MELISILKTKETNQQYWLILKFHTKRLPPDGINHLQHGDTQLINIAFRRTKDLKIIESSTLTSLSLKLQQLELQNHALLEKEIKNLFRQLF